MEIIKKPINISLAVLLLILLLSLFTIIVIFIKLNTRGPIIYKQIRLGKNGKKFVFYKFRTMIDKAEKGTPQLALKDDPRRTRVGVFLRNCYLDELPQLINIIKGEMAFVGPRPERPYFHNKFKKEIPNWEKRLEVLPGITGWAQIHNVTSYNPRRKLKLDLEYINKKSLLFDIGIVFISIFYILTGISLSKKWPK